jgi:hypothetical protein
MEVTMMNMNARNQYLSVLRKDYLQAKSKKEKPLLLEETERLRKLGEINISDKVARQLKKISSATIDRRLKKKKEAMLQLRKRGLAKPKSLLYQKIPIRLNDWDTSIRGGKKKPQSFLS